MCMAYVHSCIAFCTGVFLVYVKHRIIYNSGMVYVYIYSIYVCGYRMGCRRVPTLETQALQSRSRQ